MPAVHEMVKQVKNLSFAAKFLTCILLLFFLILTSIVRLPKSIVCS